MGKGMLPLKLINTAPGPNELKFRQRQAQTKLLSDAAHYWTPDSLPFAYALACTQIVLLHGKADKQYHEAKEAWALQDCQLAMQDFKTAYLDKNETLRGWPSLWNEPDKFTESQDFEYLVDRHAEFIKVGFNRETDQANESWKVLPSLDVPWLYKAVTTWTLGDYLGIKLEDWNKYKPLVRDGKTYDTEDIMTSKPTHRIHREVVSLFKRYGKLVHDGKLLDTAGMWHRARVLCNTLREAADYYHIDPIDLSKRIEPYDDATGWPRHK